MFKIGIDVGGTFTDSPDRGEHRPFRWETMEDTCTFKGNTLIDIDPRDTRRRSATTGVLAYVR